MARQQFSPEQIVHKLREADVELSKGTPVKQVCRQLGITDKTEYRWRREYGGLKVDQAGALARMNQPPPVLRSTAQAIRGLIDAERRPAAALKHQTQSSPPRTHTPLLKDTCSH